jgi:hypothetical protein
MRIHTRIAAGSSRERGNKCGSRETAHEREEKERKERQQSKIENHLTQVLLHRDGETVEVLEGIERPVESGVGESREEGIHGERPEDSRRRSLIVFLRGKRRFTETENGMYGSRAMAAKRWQTVKKQASRAKQTGQFCK